MFSSALQLAPVNSRQNKVLIAGAGLVALMLLFPPWDHFDRDTSGRQSSGYHFFLTPPQPKPAQEVFGNARFPHMTSIRLNDLRFILQLLITIPGWLGLLFLLEIRRTKIGVVLGVILLLVSIFIFGCTIWLIVNEGLEYGHWSLP